MTEVLWPLDLCPSSQTWNIIGNAATFTSPLSGATRTYGRPGARMGCTMTFPPMKGQDRARLLAFINTLLDRSNRAWVPDFSTTRRGSFPAPELLANNDFSNGTTGWTAQAATLAATDRTMRVTSNVGALGSVGLYQQTSLAAYVPYALRGHAHIHSPAVATSGTYFEDGASVGGGNYSTVTGLKTQSLVASASGACFAYPAIMATGTFLAGDYMDVTYASLARCFHVDGGGNLLLRSDAFDNAAWTKLGFASVSANTIVAPDGTTTADVVAEDGATSTHEIYQAVTVPSAAADYCFAVAVNIGNRSWCALEMTEGTGSTSLTQYFDAATGAVGTTGSTGGNWSGRRAFSVGMGNGWYCFVLIGRKTNAATSLTTRVYAASADGTAIYAGGSFSALCLWRATLVQSSTPVRLTQSGAVAIAASGQTGNRLHVKGLPASTQGLLRVGDPVQIGGQINFLTARLDSDAAGRGYLQCGRPWLAATNDAPVIVHQPMCKMILATDTLDLDTGPGQFSPFQIELVEAIE